MLMDVLLGDAGRRDHFTSIAKKAPKGVDKAALKIGGIVMVGPCVATGDRSYLDTIWRIIAVAPNAIIVTPEYGGWRMRDDDVIRTISLHEREVYEAADLLAAIRAEQEAQRKRKAEAQRQHEAELLRSIDAA